MGARGFGEIDADAVLVDLAELGIIDDGRYAVHYAVERSGKGFGPLKIEAELRRKGVCDELIAAAIATCSAEFVPNLRRLCNKRFGGVTTVDRKERARRWRYLNQRGFPSEMIQSLLDAAAD